jgi:hypothetical protein
MQLMGNFGCYVDDGNVLSFQMGDHPQPMDLNTSPHLGSLGIAGLSWLNLKGYNIATRGANNLEVEEIESDFKKNRLMPRLINKKVNMLYGNGPAVYHRTIIDGKMRKEWIDCPTIMDWLESWQDAGLETNYKDCARAIIKNFYYFSDFFVKWRMSLGSVVSSKKYVLGLETMENKNCRLATDRKDVSNELISYADLRFIATGKFGYASLSTFKFYPRLSFKELSKIKYAAISHHREKTIGNFYGCNESHEGTKGYIKGANQTSRYINSFLGNSLAAKVHIIIPNAWLTAKRKQITNLCTENKSRAKKKEKLLQYNGIEIGTEYKESTLIAYMQSELRKISDYLSGADNQGKAYASISFKTSDNQEERWKIETIDLKYKEYIESLIAYDKRADEAILSSVGLDSSLSSISKDGVISKSGADVFYNYLIYLMSLTPDDDICCEPFNMAIKVNFPELYKKGYRLGFYRETPTRQEETAPKDRITQQQS